MATVNEDHTNELSSRHFWTLSTGEKGAYWEEFYSSRVAAIGWKGSPDLLNFKSKDEIHEKILELQPSEVSPKNDALAYWQFSHEIQPGDIIFAKAGRTKLLGYGEVTGDYHFDPTRTHYKHVRPMNWLKKVELELPDGKQMALKTLTDITHNPTLLKMIASSFGLKIDKTSFKTAVNDSTKFWWLNANPKIWDFRSVRIGAIESYTSHNELGNKRQKFRYFEAVKPGDVLFGYVTSPDKEIVAVCEITKALHPTPDGDAFEFRKVEELNVPVTLAELQGVKDLSKCESLVNNQGSLFAVTPEEYAIIRSMIDDRNAASALPKKTYTKNDALTELFMSEGELTTILSRLDRKKAVILQGPPGVGKTFVARRLAYLMMGEKDEKRVTTVQFHPNYGYEDFIQGYRPTKNGIDRRDGVFFRFARLAKNDPARDWYFVIDEINRGNLAKIFGELLMLVEADKRGPENRIPLTYSEDADETFFLPENLYLIGTMNTADRSLAMVDFALRRRFSFVTLDPAFDSPNFEKWLLARGVSAAQFKRIRVRIGALNNVIDNERDLGPGFRIGQSYFCPSGEKIENFDVWYKDIIDGEIHPLLEEYFDSRERVNQLVSDLLE